MEIKEINQKSLAIDLLAKFTLEGVSVSQLATEGQIEIFRQLIFRNTDRLQIITPTQYGKSLFVALAAIYLSCIEGKVVAIVAPKTDKARIIMRYYIEHLGDDPSFFVELEKDTKLERLRMEESKERIILRNGGGIFVISANASNSIKGFEAAMGEGAEITILDEACLIPDDMESTIFRMIAGKKDGFYCKIGNPFYRNHFLKSWNDPRYKKIFIDYNQAISEGRYKQSFIEEASKKPHFSVLFECIFPDADAVDAQGYSLLISEKDMKIGTKVPFGEIRLGVDVAEAGGDWNALTIRWANYAKMILKYQSSDTMDLAGRIIQVAKEYNVLDRNIFIDSIGVGKGVVDRLREQQWNVNAVKFSESASDEAQFINLRAECYWSLRKWMNEGGMLNETSDWMSLLDIKYKVRDSAGRIMIMPKDEMRKQGIDSPDVPDSLALTFARKSVINREKFLTREERETLAMFDAHKNKNIGFKRL